MGRRSATKRNQAKGWLKGALAAGAQPEKAMQADGVKRGYSLRTQVRARTESGIDRIRRGKVVYWQDPSVTLDIAQDVESTPGVVEALLRVAREIRLLRQSAVPSSAVVSSVSSAIPPAPQDTWQEEYARQVAQAAQTVKDMNPLTAEDPDTLLELADDDYTESAGAGPRNVDTMIGLVKNHLAGLQDRTRELQFGKREFEEWRSEYTWTDANGDTKTGYEEEWQPVGGKGKGVKTGNKRVDSVKVGEIAVVNPIVDAEIAKWEAWLVKAEARKKFLRTPSIHF
jgi:hypothetical protein